MSIFLEKDLNSAVSTTKGTDIYNKMLLSQYANSPNLLAYAGAFLAEFDFLFEQIERVYLGRFLEYATGEQLSVLGKIVGIPRELGIEVDYFGFAGSNGSGTFGTEGDAELGAVWRSAVPNYNTIQLDDTIYRRAIRAKAMCNGAKYQSVDFMYKVISIIIGEVPSVMSLDSGTVADNENIITLTLEDASTTAQIENLILAMKPYFVPAGYQFGITLT
jgi:hypothetical protein